MVLPPDVDNDEDMFGPPLPFSPVPIEDTFGTQLSDTAETDILPDSD